ncbi:hypothetical protein SAMN03159463_03068 [Mesorhizobium sp. NFR06]|nr:hypothetical protein SAMN03159463_03068 [Mesorhizobium sp. NFR06]
MAKGQKHSNREIGKPKKEKVPESGVGNPIKLAANGNASVPMGRS